MSCDACMGAITETTPWTKGVTTSPEGDVAALLGSSVGSALFAAAISALDKYWVLRPRGTETSAQLRNRIGIIFVQRVAAEWSGPISADIVNANPAFEAIVADVSLTTRRMTAQELSAARLKKMLWIGAGVVAVGVVGLLIYRSRKNKRTSEISVGV